MRGPQPGRSEVLTEVMPAPALEVHESAFTFHCKDVTLVGVVSTPPEGTVLLETGVVIVVGGPQYRAGSHRQFVQLARSLARSGYSVMRFDCRGMGDSGGEMRSFDSAGPDVLVAIDALLGRCAHLRRVVLWGLCDAASLVLMHGAKHPNVAGLVLANPWVRSSATIAAVTVKHYYRGRLLHKDFWRKVFGDGLDWRASWQSLRANIAGSLAPREQGGGSAAAPEFQTAMALGLAAFDGPVLLLLSGEDMTAREFIEYTASAPAWKGLLGATRVVRIDLPGADHTFSRRAWKTLVEEHTRVWMQRCVC